MINVWLAMALVLAVLGGLLVGLRLLQKLAAPHPEVLRKILHISMGLCALAQLDCRHSAAYDKETLLHPNHITDGRHGTWAHWLSRELVARIEEEFAGWLRDNDYLN